MLRAKYSMSFAQSVQRFSGISCCLGLAAIASCSNSAPPGGLGIGGTTNLGEVSTGGAGGNAVSDGGGASGATSLGGGIWINRTVGTTAAGLPWVDVASDATGINLVAVTTIGTLNPDGNIWTSADAGVTWSNRTKGTTASGQYWQSVASDATGTNLVAVTRFTGILPGGEDVWTSADGGATWTKRTTVTSTARGVVGPTIVSDSTGKHLVLADGDIWSSDDSGATWTDRTAATSSAAQTWIDMASDSTATHLVGITAYSDIWTSADAGATWSNRTKGTAASGLDWQGVASDATGTTLVAVCNVSLTSSGILYAGDIWVSADSGTTWTNRTTGTATSRRLWVSVASDAAGTHLVAASSNGIGADIWTSSDSGTTWLNETTGTTASGQQWARVASDASGARLVSVTRNGAPAAGLTGTPCCFGDIWTH
jgi:hypothetical protein